MEEQQSPKLLDEGLNPSASAIAYLHLDYSTNLD